MNKKIFYIFILMVALIPSLVFAEEKTICIDFRKYTITSYNSSTSTFPYAGAIRSWNLPRTIYQGLESGKKYDGTAVITPAYYLSGLKKIRDENKNKFNDIENIEACNQREFDRRAKCILSKMDDTQIVKTAVNLANYDNNELDKIFGRDVTDDTFRRTFGGYFGYSNPDDYKFRYSIDYFDMFCKPKGNQKPFTADGTNWGTAGWSFSSCPSPEDKEEMGPSPVEKVSLDWDFPSNRWKLTIPGLYKLQVSFINENQSSPYDTDDNKVPFVHPTGRNENGGWSYDINNACCTVNQDSPVCNCGTANYQGVNVTGPYKETIKYENGKTKSVDAYTVTLYPASSTTVYYVGSYYETNGSCNGVQLYWHQISVGDSVPNPYIDDTKAKGVCTDYYLKKMQELGYPASFANLVVPECDPDTELVGSDRVRNIWTGNTGAYNGYGGNSPVLESMNAAIRYYSEHIVNKLVVDTSELTGTKGNTDCEFNGDENGAKRDSKTNSVKYDYYSLLFNDDSHKYWNANCQETITLKYSGPRALSTAGEGFTYPVEVVQTRTCEPFQVSVPTYDPVCKYGTECYGGPARHNGEPGAGPTEDYDACIQSCDGGKYSDYCTNMCYSYVYGNADTVLGLAGDVKNDLFQTMYSGVGKCDESNIGKKYKLTRMIDYVDYSYSTSAPISSCKIFVGNINTGNTSCTSTKCTTEHGIVFTYLDYCNGGDGTQGTACFEVYGTKTPCLETVNGKIPPALQKQFSACKPTDMTCYQQDSYAKKVAAAEVEYQEVVKAIQKFIDEPVSESNFYRVVLNDEGAERFDGSNAYNKNNNVYEFKNSKYNNVMYKKYSKINDKWTKSYDKYSFNKPITELSYDYYVKTVPTVIRTQRIGGSGKAENNAIYQNLYLENTSYATFYKNYDFYQEYEANGNKRDIKAYYLERRYVFNLPDAVVNTGYATTSNYDYNKAYTYDTTHRSNAVASAVYENTFMTLSPDDDGTNIMDVAEINGTNQWIWNYYANRTYNNNVDGTQELKNYGNSLEGKDINWKNIKFIYSLGTWNQVSQAQNDKQDDNPYKDLTCFYGVPSCTSTACVKDDEDIAPGGLNYIFRTIELKNMFPCNGENCYKDPYNETVEQRTPRYNWTDSAKSDYEKSIYNKNYSYGVDPQKTQEIIEKTGQEIYTNDDHIDYDIEITRDQIRAIRKYAPNGSKINYGDYSEMSCNYDPVTKMNVCMSTFLSDGKYVTFVNNKRGLLGCNNQYGNTCLDIREDGNE